MYMIQLHVRQWKKCLLTWDNIDFIMFTSFDKQKYLPVNKWDIAMLKNNSASNSNICNTMDQMILVNIKPTLQL